LVGGLDIVKELVQSGEFPNFVPKADDSISQKLKALINQSKVMLFMKGNAREPKCGFSRQIVEFLNETGYFLPK
jgi:glutaredoxin-related protein